MNKIFQFELGRDICDRIMYVCTNSFVTFNHLSRKHMKERNFYSHFFRSGEENTRVINTTKNNKPAAKQLIS